MESSPDWHRSIKLRLPLAGYYLRYWNVDCTEDHSLTGREHLLWLRNASQLKDIAELDYCPKGITNSSQEEFRAIRSTELG
ncbi:hypothetical protein [Celerinatantimonas sp. YJH-8]|uniref:hypothetical protein n=1 Tax=Celerinatantimonas sp. YJH-8 TaxID=3228714 RepID=UPI0038C832D6